MDPRPRKAVQNLNTFHAIAVPDLCIVVKPSKIRFTEFEKRSLERFKKGVYGNKTRVIHSIDEGGGGKELKRMRLVLRFGANKKISDENKDL